MPVASILSQPEQAQCLDTLSLDVREDVVQIDDKAGFTDRLVSFPVNKPDSLRICLNTAHASKRG